MLLALLSIVLSTAIGLVLGSLLGAPRITLSPLLTFSLSAGMGLGITSCVFVLWLYIAGNRGRGVVFVDLALFATLTALAARNVTAGSDELRQTSGVSRGRQPYVTFPILLVFGFCLVTALVAYGRISLAHPNGEWDAWAIWNLHARFLFRGGPFWKEGFSDAISWSHPDYPLLLPGAIARSWTYWGRESPIVPSLAAILFTLSTVGIVFSGLSILRGRTQALLGGSVLLGTPFFLTMGASQYADVPLSFYIVASLALIALDESASLKGYGLRVLAGTCAGLAVWTKNEGWVFALSLAFAQLLMALLRVPKIPNVRRLLLFLAGLAPIAGIDLLFKATVAPANYMFGNQPSVIHRLATFSRYIPVAKAFWSELFMFGNWRGKMIVLLTIYAALIGLYRERDRGATRLILSISIALTAVGYFFAYVITPVDFQWQLSTSLNRLLLQLWPGLVFLIFLMIQDPA